MRLKLGLKLNLTLKLGLKLNLRLKLGLKLNLRLKGSDLTIRMYDVLTTNWFHIFRPYSFSKIVGFEAEIAKNDRRGSQTRDKSTVLLSVLSISIANQISDPIRHLIGRLG